MENLLLERLSDQLEGYLPHLDEGTVPLKYWVCSLDVILDSLCGGPNIFSGQDAFYQLQLVAQLHPYPDKKCLTRAVYVLIISKIDYSRAPISAELASAVSVAHGNHCCNPACVCMCTSSLCPSSLTLVDGFTTVHGFRHLLGGLGAYPPWTWGSYYTTMICM